MAFLETYNTLDGAVVTREEMVKMAGEAKEEGFSKIAQKMDDILREYPESSSFEVRTTRKLEPGLAASWDAGWSRLRTSTNRKHRLKKGYRFLKGGDVLNVKTGNVLRDHERSTAFKQNKNGVGMNVPFEIHDPEGITAGLSFADLNFEANPGLSKPVSPDQIYQMITDKMIAQIKNASGDGYIKKWRSKLYKEDLFLTPVNFVSKKPYRGVNWLLLKDFDPMKVFENPYFLTFNQIKKLKGKVKKGSKGKEVIYFTRYFVLPYGTSKADNYRTSDINKAIQWALKNPKKKEFAIGTLRKRSAKKFRKHWTEKNYRGAMNLFAFPVLHYYNVFNGKDVEGIDFKLKDVEMGKILPELPPAETIPAAEGIIRHYPEPKPKINNGGDQAFYRQGENFVNVPRPQNFESAQDYYRTLFHELTHCAADPKHMNELPHGKFGSKPYAKEELVAEFGSIFLSAEAGIMWITNKNHAEYIQNWNRLLAIGKEDTRFVMRGASAAQKRADYILDRDEKGVPAYLKDLGKAKKKIKPAKDSKWVSLEEYSEESDKKNKKLIEGIIEKYKDLPLIESVETAKEELLNKGMPLDMYEALVDENEESDNFSRLENELLRLGDDGSYGSMSQMVAKIKRIATEKQKSTTRKDKFQSATGIVSFPVKDIHLDEKRFQNRNKLNEEVVKNIVENYNPTEFDPVRIWKDPKDDKYYLLAGHHRLSAMKKLKRKTIPAIVANKDFPTEKDAIRFARELSNANRTLETPVERAKIYRDYRIKEKLNKADLFKKAEKEGKNRPYILNLSYLNPRGKTISTLKSFENSTSVQDTREIEKVADWVGNARRRFGEKISDTQENEMFDFLTDKTASKRISNKVDFLQKVGSIVMSFIYDPAKPLNLKRLKYRSEGERQYDEEVEALRRQINEKQGYISDIKERFVNPLSKNYIPADAKDYAVVKKVADDKIADYNTEIKKLQKDLQELFRNKGKYTNAGRNQVALFGPGGQINISTERFKKMKVSELRDFTLSYFKENLKGNRFAIKNSLSEVILTTKSGRKIAKGGAMYSAKAAVIEKLERVISNSTYNNFGERKPNDNPEIIGYLNFKSKVVVDGKKNHVRISIALHKDRSTLLKNYDLGHRQKNKDSLSKGSKRLPSNGESKSLMDTKDNQKKKSDKNALNAPKLRGIPSLADLSKNTRSEFFNITGETGNFLGRVERKRFGSVAITMDGPQGAGKTTLLYQMMNDFASSGGNCLFLSLEESPNSALAKEKTERYIFPSNRERIFAVGEVEDREDLYELIKQFDFIFLDSWQKLIRILGRGFKFDEDLRRRFNGKVFVVIFQQTTTGRTKGGADIVYDGDIIIKMHKGKIFAENYAYFDKNRYTQTPIHLLKYWIQKGKSNIQNEVPDKPRQEREAVVAKIIR